MDQLFKQKLISLRQGHAPRTFAEALYPGLVIQSSETNSAIHSDALSQTDFTEKELILRSLESFAQEKIQESEKQKFQVTGGEVVLKSTPGWEEVAIPDSFDELLARSSLDSNVIELSLRKKRPGTLKILFVSEKFRTWEEVRAELKEEGINELLPAFSLKTSEFFMRMISAMKLTSEEILLYPVENEGNEIASEVMALAGFMRPQFVITLGASATQRILKSQERLNMLHGQFFQRQVGPELQLTIVPLYHPAILETNLNMKKTAWTVMQKIMGQLKKQP